MDSLTVRELRTVARDYGLKGYSRLRKADLVKLLEQYVSRGIIEGGTLLDEECEFDAPILVPEKRKIQKKQIPKVIEENVETISDWLNWLENVEDEVVRRKVDPKVERLKKQIENLGKTFQLKESRSALKKFATQYTIDGVRGYDPKTFLSAVKPTVIQFLNEHHNIKLKLILKCTMSKTNIATGEVEYTTAHFTYQRLK